jgi:hypothetical protein
LTTAELFDAIAKEMTGRKSEFNPPAWIVEWFLSLKLSPPLTGLPNHGVPYFFLSQTYDTETAEALLKKHKIGCPPFHSYVDKLLDFVEQNPEL